MHGLLVFCLSVCLLAGCEYKLDDGDSDDVDVQGKTDASGANVAGDGEVADTQPSSISYSGIKNIEFGFSPRRVDYEYNMDLDDDGTRDYVFVWHMNYHDGYNNGITVTAEGDNVTTARLSAGKKMDTVSSWIAGEQTLISAWYMFDDDMVGFGPWKNANDWYMGLRFMSDGNTHYGWARISYFDNYIVVHDWAYNTVAGQSIKAGATE